MAYAIHLQNLKFSYGKEALFQQLDMVIPQNVVFGLLGPNGAGKTTLIRLITGLLKPESGTVRVLEKSWADERQAILRRTGALIGQASLYGNLSAWDNLKINASWYGVGDSAIRDTLAQVGLENTGRKKVIYFSTGMKQRLGLALSLLHNPDLLILDEPLNGLDPVMRNDVRNIISKARQSGKTVLVSSHELGEIEKTCSHVAVLNKGQCIFQGAISALLEKQARTVYIRSSDQMLFARIVSGMGFFLQEDGSVTIPGDRQFAALIKQLVGQGVDVLGIETKMSGLDHFFNQT